VHSPIQKETLTEANRTALLAAIARAKGWVTLIGSIPIQFMSNETEPDQGYASFMR
jgi:hypothetical protein